MDVCRELDLRLEVGSAPHISGDLQPGDLPALHTVTDADQLGDLTELPGQVGELRQQLRVGVVVRERYTVGSLLLGGFIYQLVEHQALYREVGWIHHTHIHI